MVIFEASLISSSVIMWQIDISFKNEYYLPTLESFTMVGNTVVAVGLPIADPQVQGKNL